MNLDRKKFSLGVCGLGKTFIFWRLNRICRQYRRSEGDVGEGVDVGAVERVSGLGEAEEVGLGGAAVGVLGVAFSVGNGELHAPHGHGAVAEAKVFRCGEARA